MDAIERLAEEHVVTRLAEQDLSLFAHDIEGRQSVLQRMGWIELALTARERLPHYESIAAQLIAEGATDVVLLGMGGSSLASLVFAEVFGAAPGHPQLHVLDTTSPVTVSGLTDALDPASTWFLLASKSGTTIEPLSLYAVFRAWADEALGRSGAGKHFIAITDPGTPLQTLRRTEGMRLALPTPVNVGGRFSALTAFGLVPAALLGVDLTELLNRAAEMDRACRVPGEGNPAASLAAWVFDAREAGRDKLTIVASERYAAFPLWVEQLVAESTGKQGVGVVPVPETTMRTPSGFGEDRAVVVMRAPDDDGIAAWSEAISAEGHRVFEIEVADPLDIGAEFVRWEYATAMLGFLLGINPFDEPDVGAAKKATLDVLGGVGVAVSAADVDGALVTYAGALDAPAQPPADLAAALEPAISTLAQGDYLAILAYLPYEDARLDPLRIAASRVSSVLHTAVCLELGPRYLHSTGQLHKGGPDEGVFLVITARDAEDVAIPGQQFTLSRLHRAQAEGDLATLAGRGRRVMRVDLVDSTSDSVGALARALESAAEATGESP